MYKLGDDHQVHWNRLNFLVIMYFIILHFCDIFVYKNWNFCHITEQHGLFNF